MVRYYFFSHFVLKKSLTTNGEGEFPWSEVSLPCRARRSFNAKAGSNAVYRRERGEDLSLSERVVYPEPYEGNGGEEFIRSKNAYSKLDEGNRKETVGSKTCFCRQISIS